MSKKFNEWAYYIEENEILPREAAAPYLEELMLAVGGE